MTVTAKIISDSTNPRGTRITTFELEYPRIVHGELMTHRVFSRNAASSRAIPVSAMIKAIEDNPAMPSHWGKNQAGMKAKEELDDFTKEATKGVWLSACKEAIACAKVMNNMGVHKQVVNRITEPYQHMKIVLTGTEFNNWFWLRDHEDADPTIKELAHKMHMQYQSNKPKELSYGQWHLPYVDCTYDNDKQYYSIEGESISLEDAKMISASACAQVSYRKTDMSLEKARMIYKLLIESEPCHASPVEHSALCFDDTEVDFHPKSWPEGITHMDCKDNLWSGNFRDWIQMRQLIPNNAKYN